MLVEHIQADMTTTPEGICHMPRIIMPAKASRIPLGCARRPVAIFLQSFLLLSSLMLPSCSSLVARATDNLADNLSQAIANNDDPATVEAGGPAYLLMLDGMVQGDPQNENLLIQAATLYSTYSTAFVDDPERAAKLSQRALDYAERALCVRQPEDCGLRQAEFDIFENRIQKMDRADVPAFYTLGAAWAGWIQARQDDLEAVAELARVEAIMTRIVEVDETYRQGSAHLYLGTFAILVPPALGGQPEVARMHFERAIALSDGSNLMAKVLYAERYARMLYDRELHDRLLTEVLAADPHVPGLVLQNTLAQERAQELLTGADAYF
jgi:hypothetical protein